MRVGIDIGGSHIAIGLINEKGEILEKAEQDVEKCNHTEKYIVDYVNNYIEKFSKIANISYIGIAAPGNPNGCIITNLVNLGIKKLDFHIIEDKFQIKIKSINDAKAAAMAEKTYGSMKEFHDGVFLCLGTGIGGAVFLNDILLQSNRNPGFEIGHMVIEKDGNLCNCGKKGCFETYCSMKRFKKKIIEELNNTSGEKIDLQIEEPSNIVKLLKENLKNERIMQLVDEYINNLIIGLSNVIDIFEPEVIALGGSFVYFQEVLYQKLVETMNERRYVFNKESLPEIKLAKFKNDAGLIGATLL